MKIKSVRIENLRAFKDETVALNDYTCLVGPNGAGKSTVLCALNLFFRETSNSPVDLTQLEEEDFFQKDTAKPIKVTVTFKDLSPEAQSDFAGYFRQNELVVTAVAEYELETKRAEVKHYGERLVMADFAPFFKAEGDGQKVAELTKLYTEIRNKITELPVAKTKDAMISALRDYEGKHTELCTLLPSQDQFYGVSKGSNRLAKYIQWVFVPAIKDPTSEQAEGRDSALTKLLARTVHSKINFNESLKELRTKAQGEYQDLLSQNQGALNHISQSLKTRLASWAHPEANLRLEWRQNLQKAVQIQDPYAEIIAGEGQFEGKLARFGHGFQRSYLLALLQELSGSDDANGPRLILAVEEPELYQHPPQARHLAEVLKNLSKRNSQVVVCTHSPLFVSGDGFEDVRMIRKDKATSIANAKSVTLEQIAKSIADAKGDAQPAKVSALLTKIHQELQPHINEMFFSPFVILVEGLEDIAHITTYMHLTGKWDEYRRLGCHLVATNGKSFMIQPLAILNHMRIPYCVVLDSDADKPDKSGSRIKHEKDNTAILNLCGVKTPVPLPADTFWGDKVVMWKSNIGSIFAGDIDPSKLAKYEDDARSQCGNAGGLDKNSVFIANLLTTAWEDGSKSANLEKLCASILNAAAA